MNKASLRHRRPLHAMLSVWHAAKEWRIESWGRPRFNPSGEIAGHARKSAGITGQKKAEGIGRHFRTAHETRVNERAGIAESRVKLLQSLAVELILAEESERRRIADFLHEDLQQIIASARMQVQSAVDNPDPNAILEEVEQLLGDSLEKSRRLSYELSPPVLHQFGLVAALEWLVRHMDKTFGLTVRLKSKLTSEITDAAVKVFLFRAAQELLLNVVKHSGSDIDSADVHLYDSDKVVTLSVSDQGDGFDPGILDSHTRKTGIGLLSLRERAAAIGGNLDIRSAPGRGSRFTLMVPKSLDLINGSESPLRDSDFPSGMPEKKAVDADAEIIRVLLVDDHEAMRQALSSMIAVQPDIRVAGEACSGEEALELARQLEPDVIIMDISMPGMGGVEAARRVKSEFPGIRVIGLSMFADDIISNRMREAGADGFVSKSESSSELLKAIHRLRPLRNV
jgi:signal transduction histidine kinase/ActR/RegA family two-component response regulator